MPITTARSRSDRRRSDCGSPVSRGDGERIARGRAERSESSGSIGSGPSHWRRHARCVHDRLLTEPAGLVRGQDIELVRYLIEERQWYQVGLFTHLVERYHGVVVERDIAADVVLQPPRQRRIAVLRVLRQDLQQRAILDCRDPRDMARERWP